MSPAGILPLVAMVASMTSPPAAPEVKTVSVQMDSPDGCGNAEDFFASLESRTNLVRRPTAGESGTTLQVRLIAMRHYVVGELRIVDDRGQTDTRKVQGPNCADVLEALSLAAAVALDPRVLLPPASAAGPAPPATAGPAPPATAAANQPPALPLPSALTAAAPEASDAPPSPTSPGASHFDVGAAAAGAYVLSSGVSTGPSVLGRWTPSGGGAFRPTLGVGFIYLRNDVLMSPGAAQATLTGLALTVCAAGWQGRVTTVKPCVLGMTGVLSVSGQQVLRTSTVGLLWLSAGAVMRTAVRLGRGFSLDLDAGASVPFNRREFYTTLPSHVVDKTAVVSPVLTLGISHGL